MKKADLLATGEPHRATFWPTPSLTEEPLASSGFLAEGTLTSSLICVSAVPHFSQISGCPLVLRVLMFLSSEHFVLFYDGGLGKVSYLVPYLRFLCVLLLLFGQTWGRGGKTTSGNGQAWSLPSPREQCRIGKNGGNRLWNHLWCPNDTRDSENSKILII